MFSVSGIYDWRFRWFESFVSVEPEFTVSVLVFSDHTVKDIWGIDVFLKWFEIPDVSDLEFLIGTVTVIEVIAVFTDNVGT